LLCGSDDDNDLTIKVADFGLSRMFQEGGLNTYCGSPEYVAPEVLECQVCCSMVPHLLSFIFCSLGGVLQPYDDAVDLWSVGVITYILLTGFLPFYDKKHAVLFQKIKDVEYNWDECPEISQLAKDFIETLLVKEPAKRATAQEALDHPWIAGADDGDNNELRKVRVSTSFHDNMRELNSKRRTPTNSPAGSFVLDGPAPEEKKTKRSKKTRREKESGSRSKKSKGESSKSSKKSRSRKEKEKP
jgi:calcium/calmodulin-dependent protein kinase I